MRIIHFLQPSGHQAENSLAYVVDLIEAQAANGHEVGIVSIEEHRPPQAPQGLAKSLQFCRLGVKNLRLDSRNFISRLRTIPLATRKARQFVQAQTLPVDILHGHGEIGGLLARHIQKNLPRKKPTSRCIFSPYDAALTTNKSLWPLSQPETALWPQTHGIIFDSTHSQARYIKRFGSPPRPTSVILRGLAKKEFAPRQIIDMASDFLYVGDLYADRGIDTLIKALARMKTKQATGALIVGAGPQEATLRAQVERYGLSHQIFFNAPLEARTAFMKGSCLVLVSKSASIPPIVLQAAAAGLPMILSDAGGIDELIGDIQMPLIKPGDTNALQEQMLAYLDDPQPFLTRASALKQRAAKLFTLAGMCDKVNEAYELTLQ